MTIDVLREHLSRRPFEPFRVVVPSGQSYEIRHPEMAILMRNGLLVANGGGDGDLPDRSAHPFLLHIASLENLAPAAGTG